MPDGDETMPHVLPEQVARTREMDLLTYLQRHKPDVLMHLSGNTANPKVDISYGFRRIREIFSKNVVYTTLPRLTKFRKKV